MRFSCEGGGEMFFHEFHFCYFVQCYSTHVSYHARISVSAFSTMSNFWWNGSHVTQFQILSIHFVQSNKLNTVRVAGRTFTLRNFVAYPRSISTDWISKVAHEHKISRTRQHLVSQFMLKYAYLVFHSLAQHDRIRVCTVWLEGTVGPRSVQRKLTRGSFGRKKYEGWNFNSGNYLFTTDTK